MKTHRCVEIVMTAILLQVLASGCSTLRQPANPSVTAREFIGVTLIARSDFLDVDEFTSFGSSRAPANATCEFVANEVYTSLHGDVFERGDSFTIGNATILEHMDGYGNTGTKLILESAEPRKGLTLYCYGWEPDKKRFWALDRGTVMNILNEKFEIEE